MLTLADPRLPDRKLSWLDDEEGLDHLRVEVEVSTGGRVISIRREPQRELPLAPVMIMMIMITTI